MEQGRGRQTVVAGAAALVVALIIGLGTGWLIGQAARSAGGAHDAVAGLDAQEKEAYAILVAEAYAFDGDLGRAEARLARLVLGQAKAYQAFLKK